MTCSNHIGDRPRATRQLSPGVGRAYCPPCVTKLTVDPKLVREFAKREGLEPDFVLAIAHSFDDRSIARRDA
jgi:hypothetical protein